MRLGPASTDVRAEFAAVFMVGAGIWLFAGAFKRLRLKRAVEDTPRSSVAAAAVGRCELNGTAEPFGAELAGPFSGLPCIWYRWKVEEEHRDSKGGSHWSTLAQGESGTPFTLKDASGSVGVHPQGAEVETDEPLVYRSGALNVATVAKGPLALEWAGAGGIFSSPRRLSEWNVPSGAQVLVLGVLRSVEGSSEDAPVKAVMLGSQGEPFFISTRGRDQVEKELLWSVWLRMVGGAALAIAGAALLAAMIQG